MTLPATVSISWVNTVLSAAQRQGVARETLLAQAGIAAHELHAERWPIDHITRLWCAAVRSTRDPGFGLKAGAGVGPASFNVVSFLLQSAPTLREAFALVQECQSLISDGGRFQTFTGADSCWVVYHPNQGQLAFSPHQIAAVLAAAVVFARWVTGTPFRPLAVQFSQAQLGPLAGYREVFRCPVAFEQAFSGVLVSNALLEAARSPPAPGRRATGAGAPRARPRTPGGPVGTHRTGADAACLDRRSVADSPPHARPGGARAGPDRAHPGAAPAGPGAEFFRLAR